VIAHDPFAPPVISATPYDWCDPASIPLRPWLYGNQLLRGSVALVVAPGATGKTALMTGVALSLASGKPLLGRSVWGGPKRVWLWNLEDSGAELARGIQAAALWWNLKPEDLGPRLYVDSGLDGAELKVALSGPDGCEIATPLVEALIAELAEREIDVLIIDPFVSSHGVQENDNGAIDAVAKLWARVAVRARCAVVLVHHARKLGEGEVNAEAARGAVALVAAARSVVTLNRMTAAEAKRFGVEGESRRRYFRIYDDKSNRAPPAEASEWFQLESVPLGNGEHGGDSLPVVVPWTPSDAFDEVSLGYLRTVQDVLATGAYRVNSQAKPWAGEAVAQVMGLELTRPADMARVKTLLRTWTDNGALRIELKKDTKSKPRPFLLPGERADLRDPPLCGTVVAKGGEGGTG